MRLKSWWWLWITGLWITRLSITRLTITRLTITRLTITRLTITRLTINRLHRRTRLNNLNRLSGHYSRLSNHNGGL